MNLLLVDDDPLELQIIEFMIDKKKFCLEEIYTALSLKQAVEILESKEISIVITDIQMPKGTGIELVQWINENGLSIQSIFLTSHALFQYAKEAIRLNMAEYLLKPVEKEEIEQALEHAIQKVQESTQIEVNKKLAKYWNSSKILLKQEFWKKIIFELDALVIDRLSYVFEKYGLTYDKDKKIYPILLSWKRKKDSADIWSDSTIRMVINNIACEILFGNTYDGNIIYEQDKIVILYDFDIEVDIYIYSKCEMMSQKFIEYLHFCDINLYVNKSVPLLEIKSAVYELLQAEKQDIKKDQRVLDIKNLNRSEQPYEKPDMEYWVSGILNGRKNICMKQIDQYLKKYVGQDLSFLNRFQQDFLQELYIILKSKGIYANSIFKKTQMVELFNYASRSVNDMETWIEELVTFLINYEYEIAKTPSIVNKIKDYVEANLDGNLSRNELAGLVYLHPDYLSHIFKEQIGISISDYIIERRIRKAKILLESTPKSISEIALNIGYPNTAYFTKIFKRFMDMTPKDYRKNYYIEA